MAAFQGNMKIERKNFGTYLGGMSKLKISVIMTLRGGGGGSL